MIFTYFYKNWLIIDREIDEKQALMVSCGLRHNVSYMSRCVCETHGEESTLRGGLCG